MAYKQRTKDKAFKMFCDDITMEDIRREMKISTDTLWRWHNKYEWAQRKQTIKQRALEKTEESLVDIKVRQREIIKAVYAKLIKRLTKDSKNPIVPEIRDIAPLMKQELLLAGEATERLEHDAGYSIRELFREIEEEKAEKGGDKNAGQKQSRTENPKPKAVQTKRGQEARGLLNADKRAGKDSD